MRVNFQNGKPVGIEDAQTVKVRRCVIVGGNPSVGDIPITNIVV